MSTTEQAATEPADKPRERSWLGSRIARGLVEAPAEYRAWRAATEYDDAVAVARENKDQTKLIIAQDRKRDAIAARTERMRWFWAVALPFAAGGWFWVTLTCGLLLAAAVAAHVKLSVKVPGQWLGKAALAFGVSLGTEILVAAIGMHPDVHIGAWAWRPWMLSGLAIELVIGLIVLIAWAGPDGTIADNLRDEDMAPADPGESDYGGRAILDAIEASEAKLAGDTRLQVVAPGIIPLAGGTIWKATLDTGGPSAEPILAARDDIASRLGLSESRLIVERDPGYGRRVTVTGIVGNPWGPPTRSPLMDAQRFAFGTDPLPYGMTIERDLIDLPIFEMHYLVGGMPRRGKSTSCYPMWIAAALDPLAPIWVIDGGEVDTAVLKDAGLTRRWTNDPEEAFDVLGEIEEEVEHRQGLLRAAQLKRPNAEFYAEHGMSDGLVVFDEFATFTTNPDVALAKKISKRLVSLLQRSPKTNIHFVLSTQSPSSNAFDTDGRGVVPGRIALLCDSSDMSDKVLGRYTAARLGIDASRLPSEKDKKGVQWLRTHEGARVVRPHLIDDDQMAMLVKRASVLRGGAKVAAKVPSMLTVVHDLLRQRGVESMRTAEVVGRLINAGHNLPEGLRGQQVLAATLSPLGVSPTQVRADNNLSHYFTADLTAAVEGDGRPEQTRRLRIV